MALRETAHIIWLHIKNASFIHFAICDHLGIEMIPVWIENLGRAMPKGSLVPLPLLCTITFGLPVTLAPEENKETFLSRARQALLDLAPPAD